MKPPLGSAASLSAMEREGGSLVLNLLVEAWPNLALALPDLSPIIESIRCARGLPFQTVLTRADIEDLARGVGGGS